MSEKDNEFESEESKIVFPEGGKMKDSDVSLGDKLPEHQPNDDPETVLNEESEVETKVEIKKPAQKKKSPFNRFIAYLMVTTATLGLSARFFTLRKGKQGSWFLFALFMLIINLFFITERFYKSEFNDAMKSNFGEAAITIPDDVFESTGDSIDYKKLYEELSLTNQNLKEQLSNKGLVKDLSPKVAELTETLSSKEQELVQAKQQLADELNKPPVVPDIAFVSFQELDSIVGCTSKFAERKKVDIFKEDYIGKWVQFKLTITKIHEDKIELKDENNVPVIVELQEAGSGYNLLVDDELTITFILESLGGCERPYTGTHGAF